MSSRATAGPLAWIAAAASGVLTFLAYPGWNWHPLAWVCLLPILLVARDATPGRGFKLGLVGGLVTNAGGFWWMTEMLREFGHLPAVAAWAILLLQALTQGLSLAVGIGLWRWLVRRGAGEAPAAWIGVWAGEAVVPMIFPWFFGNALSPQLPMIQIADLGGVSLVSAVVIAANVALADLLRAGMVRKRPDWLFDAWVCGTVILVWFYGIWRIAEVDAAQAAAAKVKVGLVEGNIGIWEKEARHLDPVQRALTRRHNLIKHQRMTSDLQARGAELVLWPESAYMPMGPLPVAHALHDFLLVGQGGAIATLGADNAAAVAPDRLGLPRDLGMLSGLSAARGDLWRAIDGGRRIVSVSPGGATTHTLPDAAVAVATVSPPPDWNGSLRDGWIVGRTGRLWRLAWPAEGMRAVGVPRAELQELSTVAPPGLDLTAAAVDADDRRIAVGRNGAIVRWGDASLVAMTSPTAADLWAVAAEPLGSSWVAAGSSGAALTLDGDQWRAHTVGSRTWFGAWACPGGDRWVGGEGGQVAVLSAGERLFRLAPSVDADVLAGACALEGDVVLVGRGGRLWRGDGRGPWKAVGGTPRGEITAILALAPQPALAVPRTARRILPSRTPLPAVADYPQSALTDQGTPELDRSTPRRGFDVPLLFGALSHGGALAVGDDGHCDECYNSAVLLDKDGVIRGINDKVFLLAFGEYMPFGDTFPWLYQLSPETSRFRPGTKTAPIEYRFGPDRHARMGILVCYEDLLPRQAQRVAAHNPNVFINLTNDAWFGQTAEPEHHLNLALLRSVEYRRWLVRSTNTGISVFIDAAGRRVAETRLTDAETLLRDVPLLEARTVYSYLGDWPLAFLALGVAWLAYGSAPARAVSVKTARRRQKSTS
ncbi:MAG: apolipoprotein N-acyltransferase [Deltaproteobacteria bacterium]|nr:apolipoprotein N-acyltransferase [Deltaproteobacteria bacterium]